MLKEGDEVEAKFTGIDRKNRTISLSIKAKDTDEEKNAIEDYTRSTGGATTTLGDILKGQIEGGTE